MTRDLVRVGSTPPSTEVVNGCEAQAPPHHGRKTCVFVGQSGVYLLEIRSDVRHAWARLVCNNAEVRYDDTYYDATTKRIDGGVCTMEVAACSVLPGNPANFGALGHAHLLP